MNERILTWLRTVGFPDLEPEYLGPREGDRGLFCQGREVVRVWWDILGRRTCRQRVTFLVALRTREPEELDRLLALEPVLLQTVPVFGEDQQLCLEKGRTVKHNGSGIPVIEVKLTVEFTEKEET